MDLLNLEVHFNDIRHDMVTLQRGNKKYGQKCQS